MMKQNLQIGKLVVAEVYNKAYLSKIVELHNDCAIVDWNYGQTKEVRYNQISCHTQYPILSHFFTLLDKVDECDFVNVDINLDFKLYYFQGTSRIVSILDANEIREKLGKERGQWFIDFFKSHLQENKTTEMFFRYDENND